MKGWQIRLYLIYFPKEDIYFLGLTKKTVKQRWSKKWGYILVDEMKLLTKAEGKEFIDYVLSLVEPASHCGLRAAGFFRFKRVSSILELRKELNDLL